MRKWVLKAIIQKSISFLPYKHQINFLFQKYITKGVQLSDHYLEDKLIHFRNHTSFYQKNDLELDGLKIVELGSGWYPVLPLCFYLAGAETVLTVDIANLMNVKGIKTTIQKLLLYKEEGKLSEFFTGFKQERFQILEELVKNDHLSMDKFQEATNIQYVVGDARKMPVEEKTKDFIISNNTFEHVFPEVLEGILVEFDRILKKGGIMSHFIDMSDHFAHLDDQITIYNFLRFTPSQWDWIDNSIQPQNRLRIDDYRNIYKKLGIQIIKEKNRPGDLEKLKTINLAAPFDQKIESDLAISHSYLISRK